MTNVYMDGKLLQGFPNAEQAVACKNLTEALHPSSIFRVEIEGEWGDQRLLEDDSIIGAPIPQSEIMLAYKYVTAGVRKGVAVGRSLAVQAESDPSRG